jgi:hypothetical protein
MANSTIDTSIADLPDRDATLSYDDDFEEEFSSCVACALLQRVPPHPHTVPV